MVIEVFANDVIVWGGSVNGEPIAGDVFIVKGEKERCYRFRARIWTALENNAISIAPTRFDAIEIDPATGNPVEPLVKPAKLVTIQ